MQPIDALKAQVELIQSESERVKALVGSLPLEALERPSPCEKWDVGEVVAHLIWFAETYGGMMERGLRGDQSPPLGFPADPGALSKAAAEELYAQGAIDKRRSLGPDLFATFQGRYDRLNAMLNGIGPEDWGKPCFHTRRTRSVESFLPTIIAELAVHAWDIRSTLEPAPSLSVDSVPILMEKIPGNSRPWAIPSPGNHTLSGVLRYRFELKGPGADSKDIVIEGDTARMEDSIGGPASLCLAGNTEHFVLLMYGRLRLASSISTGHFKAEGDTELVSDFDRWLGGH